MQRTRSPYRHARNPHTRVTNLHTRAYPQTDIHTHTERDTWTCTNTHTHSEHVLAQRWLTESVSYCKAGHAPVLQDSWSADRKLAEHRKHLVALHEAHRLNLALHTERGNGG